MYHCTARLVVVRRSVQLSSSKATIDKRTKLGGGNFADVYGGEYAFRKGVRSVAFKVFRNVSTMEEACRDKNLRRELDIGVKIHHPNLVKVYGIVQIDTSLCLVMERMLPESLGDRLRKKDDHMPWKQRLSLARNIADGMLWLHELEPMPVVHRDLKSSNVLLYTDENDVLCAKVADFGLSKEFGSAGSAYGGSVGTLAWSAPETFSGRFNEKSDVYSYGMVLYELGSRTTPFDQVSRQQILKYITNEFKFSQKRFDKKGESREEQLDDWLDDNPIEERRPDLAHVEVDCPPMILRMMQKCWADSPTDRPDFSSLSQMLAGGLPKPNPVLDALVAKIADAGLSEVRLKLTAALSKNDYGTTTDILVGFLENGASVQNTVPLCERSGALLLRLCLEDVEGQLDRGMCTIPHTAPLMTAQHPFPPG